MVGQIHYKKTSQGEEPHHQVGIMLFSSDPIQISMTIIFANINFSPGENQQTNKSKAKVD